MTVIHTVIVDDHCDVTPFLFSLWRRKIIPIGIPLVHIDAHPDLSIPSNAAYRKKNISSVATKTSCKCNSCSSVLDWKDAKVLEDILDCDGGIAEFLLPLLYNGYVSQCNWYRSPWSDQIDDGTYDIIIGDNIDCNHACISLKKPYYIVDNVVQLQSNMVKSTIKASKLIVSTIDNYSITAIATDATTNGWILDICLDYFTTSNPFLSELIELIKSDVNSDAVSIDDVEVTRIIDSIKKLYAYVYEQSSVVDQRRFESYINAIEDLSNSELKDRSNTNRRTTAAATDIGTHNDLELSNDADDKTFCSLYFNMVECTSILSSKLLLHILDLKFLMLLPHNISQEDERNKLFVGLSSFISDTCKLYGIPSAVTIARSKCDGYTPNEVVDILQDKCLSILSACIFEYNNSTLQVHSLYEANDEDIWSLAYDLFLPDSAKRLCVRKEE